MCKEKTVAASGSLVIQQYQENNITWIVKGFSNVDFFPPGRNLPRREKEELMTQLPVSISHQTEASASHFLDTLISDKSWLLLAITAVIAGRNVVKEIRTSAVQEEKQSELHDCRRSRDGTGWIMANEKKRKKKAEIKKKRL